MENEVTVHDGTMSATVGKLADALNKAQAEIQIAKRASENPFFHSNYADLESVWAACREALATYGLAVAQTMGGTAEGVTVVTTLLHTSGEWIRGKLTLRPVKSDPQAIGSAITYGRRYSLAAIVGVVPANEDDDGNKASGRSGEDLKPSATTTERKPAPPSMSAPAHGGGEHTAVLKLGEVKTKTGQSAKGPWCRWFTKADDGQFYSTFDKGIGDTLENLAGETVNMTYTIKTTLKGEQRTVMYVEPEIDGAAEQAESDRNSEAMRDLKDDEQSSLPF